MNVALSPKGQFRTNESENYQRTVKKDQIRSDKHQRKFYYFHSTNFAT